MKDKIAAALREAILFMEAPPDSPRHWPVSRGNLTKLLTEAQAQRKVLTKLLTEAQAQRKVDHDTELERCKSGILKMAALHGRIPAI